MVPKELFPGEEEVAQWRDEIIGYYDNFPGFEGDPVEKADKIIEECKKGWTNAPKTFEKRILIKARMKGRIREGITSWGVAKRAEGAIENGIEREFEQTHGKNERKVIYEHIGLNTILNKLRGNDRKFFKQRWAYYNREFDINSSSDYALLMEVVVDELEQKRIAEARADCGPEDEDKLVLLSKVASECLVRIEKAQKALGITREQRKDELDSDGETIAELAVSLDRKKKKLDLRKEMQSVEEEEMMKVKYSRNDTYPVEGLPRPLHNRIPDMAEISKILRESGVTDG
jgi:hypothetical protein